MATTTFSVATPADFSPVIRYILTIQPPSHAAHIITLTGDLGAGKTTFTQELAKHLGVSEPVVSPTFVVMKYYDIPKQGRSLLGGEYENLVHIDAYRFEDKSEAGPLRLTELFADPANLICIEWPERIIDILPEERIDVTIELYKDEKRQVTVTT